MLTEQQLEARDNRLGASDIAKAYVGIYGGFADVVTAKLTKKRTLATPQMDRGNRWEPILRDLAADALGKVNPESEATADSTIPVVAMLDADLDGDPVELKTCGKWSIPQWEYYEAQLRVQMWAANAPRGFIALGTVDDETDSLVDFEIREFSRDINIERDLQRVAADLWAAITNARETGVIDVNAETLQGAKEAWPAPEPMTVVEMNSTAANAALVDFDDAQMRVAHLEKLVKAAKKDRDNAELRIRNLMRDRETLVTNSGIAKIIRRGRRTFDAAAAAAARPDLVVTRTVTEFDRDSLTKAEEQPFMKQPFSLVVELDN